MKFFYEALAKALDLSPQYVAVGGAIFGILLTLLGLNLLTRIFESLQPGSGEGCRQQLLPTLAEDVLDADLGAIYARTLHLDAQLFNARCPWPEGHSQDFTPVDEPTRVGETGSALGRALRKLVLRIQAKRFASRSEGETHKQKTEPLFTEARLALMSQVLDEALSFDAASSEIDPALDILTLKIEQSRRALEEPAAGEEITNG